MIRSFVQSQGVVNARNILAVEQEFKFEAGRFQIMGFIDRVDVIDEETIEIVDYKTNRMLFTRDEVDNNLQLSLYEIAARELWPWVKNVRLSFEMLRHGIRMTTERTPEELLRALYYAESVGEMTEAATEFPAKLNSNCVYCDHRKQCPPPGPRLIPEASSRIRRTAYERGFPSCTKKVGNRAGPSGLPLADNLPGGSGSAAVKPVSLGFPGSGRGLR